MSRAYSLHKTRTLVALNMAFAVCLASVFTHAAEVENLWSNVQKAGVLRCGVHHSMPYSIRDPKTGQYSGFFPELCRDFAQNVLKVKAELVETAWEAQIPGVQSRKWDMAVAVNQTAPRALAISFSANVSDNQTSFLMKKDNPKLARLGNTLSDYDRSDIKVVVITGTVSDRSVTDALKKASIIRLPGADETRLALMAGRADILADSDDSNTLFARANSDWVKEVIPHPALAKQPVSFALRRDVSWQDMQVLNIYLNEQRESGKVDELIEQAMQKAMSILTNNP